LQYTPGWLVTNWKITERRVHSPYKIGGQQDTAEKEKAPNQQ